MTDVTMPKGITVAASGPTDRIPLAEPLIAGNEWRYVKECLDTGWVSSVGAFVSRFERGVADTVGIKHAVAMTSGTAALHVALLVSGIQPDDEVIVPALTFVAPANAARYVQAWPVFVDIDPDHWQLDPAKLEDFVEHACERRDGELWDRATGRRVRAVLPVDLLGHPCDMDAINQIAARDGLVVIEDATESLGARYRGRSVGTSGLACLSFNGNKLITTGGGGMLLTDDDAGAERARYLSTQARDDPVEYVHDTVGYNYRLSNVLAAIGLAQLERLDEHVARKRQIAEGYRALGEIPGIRLPREAPWAFSTYWLYTVTIDEQRYGMGSRALRRHLLEAGMETRPLWRPLHLLSPFSACYAHRIEIAEIVQREALSLPSSVSLDPASQARVMGEIRRHAAC